MPCAGPHDQADKQQNSESDQRLHGLTSGSGFGFLRFRAAFRFRASCLGVILAPPRAPMHAGQVKGC